jgi:hypothetical protein
LANIPLGTIRKEFKEFKEFRSSGVQEFRSSLQEWHIFASQNAFCDPICASGQRVPGRLLNS